MTGFRERATRARALARRRPEAREGLTFYAGIADLQSGVDPEHPLASFARLRKLVEARGPARLKFEARELDEASCRAAMRRYLSGEDMQSTRSFFARVLLQPLPAQLTLLSGGCPRCGHPPQVGCLRPQGDGTAASLVCSLCFTEWPFSRGRCSRCDAAAAYHEAEELPHLRVQMCESCRRYLHLVRLDVEPQAIPEVDELAALSLDVWARGEGYEKIFPNLLGI